MTALNIDSRDPDSFPEWRFPTLNIEYEPGSQSVWMAYKEQADPFYSRQTLDDMLSVMASVRRLFRSPRIAQFPIRYFVMASDKAGVFNLGGDLAMFASAIREGDRGLLSDYAHACIDVIHGLVTALGLPIVTLSVITGQALGGGLEAALAEDFVLADETARIGVPEIAFNTFPGMGAVSLLSRRLGAARAEEIIASGEIHSGRAMFEMGVIDMAAPEGEARKAALAWMNGGGSERYGRRLALAQARRSLYPVSYEELIKITDLWVETSCDVTPQNLRHMERLAAAQRKMFR